MGRAITRPLAALLVLGLSGCSGDGGSSACGRPQRQQAQFPAGHILPDQPEPTYLSDPPTSGPHAPLAKVEPVYSDALPRPTQVGILETGAVLLQYQPGLPPDQRDRLLAFGGDGTVVAPNPSLDRAVVASAWLYLMRCSTVDDEALRDFVAEHRGRGPGGH